MIVGYARLSTNGQTFNAQQSALRDAGCDQIFADKESGAKTDRQQLAAAMATLAAGDTLVVTKLDRLAPDATVRSVPAANVCALDSARLPATMLIVVWPAAMAASSWACVLISTARTGVGTTASDRQRPALTSALPDKSARRARSRAGHLRARATSPPRSHSENGYIVGFPNEFPSQPCGQ